MNMLRLLLFCLPILFLACSEADNNPILSTRDRTILEKKIEGTWDWSTPMYSDRVTFRDDLTFEGVKDNLGYAGTFFINGDSVLHMNKTVIMNGSAHDDLSLQKITWLESTVLKLQYNNTILVYYKAP